MADLEFRSACILTAREEDVGAGRPHPVRVCVIDVGTNSFHTVIVDAYPNGAYEILDRFKEMVRLGERGSLGGYLSEAAIERSIRALLRVTQLAEGWGVTEYLAYATSAVREARNGGDFILRVREATGIRVRAIDGDHEGFLIYQGVRRAVEMREPVLIVDIGGGSTEFIVCTSEEVYFRTSLKLGAARMTAEFITTDPIERDEFRALRTHYRNELQPVLEAARKAGVKEIIGSSGTMENLAEVCIREYGDPELTIYQQTLDAESFRNVTRQVMTSSRKQRAKMKGIDRNRVGQVTAGAILADVLVKDLEIERIRISPNALREGMVEDFIRANSKRLRWAAPFSDIRRRAVYEHGFRFRWNRRHVHHVTALALQLFDATGELHGLGIEERELLEYASLLHDIGYHISRSSHHKHSKYLITQADWQGFLPREIEIMAHVARYHRGSLPHSRHTSFAKLSTETQYVIRSLASFLRIAEGLDRSHFQNVTHLRTRLADDELEIIIRTRGDAQLDLWGGRRASDLFENTFGRRVSIRTESGQNGDDDEPMNISPRSLSVRKPT